MKRSISFFLGLGILLGVSTGSAETIFDDFNDGEDTNPPWSLIDVSALLMGPPGERTFGSENDQYRLSGAALASLRNDFIMEDGIVRVELKAWAADVTGGTSVGLLLRFQQSLSGYFMSIDFDGSPQINLVRLDNGGPSDSNATGQSLEYNQANTYILEAEATGDQIVGRVYEVVGETVTLFDEVTLTDATYAAGPSGLLVANNSLPAQFDPGDATFDNFFATDGNVAAPELVNVETVDANLTFGVKGEPGREYTVEYQPSVETIEWTVLTTIPRSPFSETNLVVEPTGQTTRIYRASTPED
jgi:hypothetical protein